MDISLIEREITESIRDTLKSKGVNESHVKIKARTKMTSARIPVKAQGVKGSMEIVEWPKTVVTVVKMKLSIDFVPPDK